MNLKNAHAWISFGFSWGTNISNHSSSVSIGSCKTYKFFFVCRFVLCPISEHTKADDGMERISCKCLAPLFLHFSLLFGKGIFIRLPLSKGLQDTIFIFKDSAVSSRDPHYWFFSAKTSGIITLIWVIYKLQALAQIWSHGLCLPLSLPICTLILNLNVRDGWALIWSFPMKPPHNIVSSFLFCFSHKIRRLCLVFIQTSPYPKLS